jgi:UPF0716 protein FxsA
MNPLLLILILPVLEIVGFILVGDWIGTGPTIGLLLLAAIIGVFLVRHRGLASLTRAQTASAQGQPPIGAVLDSFCEVAAGVLLIIPGFLSDLLAVALLIRPLRRVFGRLLFARMAASTAFQFNAAGFGQPGPGSGPGSGHGFSAGARPGGPFTAPPGVIDGDFHEVPDAPASNADDTRSLSDSQWGKRPPEGGNQS